MIPRTKTAAAQILTTLRVITIVAAVQKIKLVIINAAAELKILNIGL